MILSLLHSNSPSHMKQALEHKGKTSFTRQSLRSALRRPSVLGNSACATLPAVGLPWCFQTQTCCLKVGVLFATLVLVHFRSWLDFGLTIFLRHLLQSFRHQKDCGRFGQWLPGRYAGSHAVWCVFCTKKRMWRLTEATIATAELKRSS